MTSTIQVNGQIFVSKLTDDTLFGPENVSGNLIEMAPQFLEEIESRIEMFTDLESKDMLSIDKLQKKKHLRKRQKRQLRILENEIKLIHFDLSNLNILKEKWNAINQSARLLDASLKSPENCYTVQTDAGQYSLDQLELTPVLLKGTYQNKIVIKVENLGTKKAWVKQKGDKHCASRDPNDCYVWCMKEVRNDCYSDMNHEKYLIEEYPPFFTFDEEKSIMVKILSEGNDGTEKIDVKLKENGKTVSVSEWEMIDCQ